MKEYIKFHFTEEYFPTPLSEETKSREVVSSTLVNIKEVSEQDAPIVMVVKHNGDEDCQIRAYKGKLFRNIQETTFGGNPMEKNVGVETMDFQDYIHPLCIDNAWRRSRVGEKTAKDSIRANARKLLVIKGKMFEATSEPVYYLFREKDGEEAGMTLGYRGYVLERNCYSALQREECIRELRKMLLTCSNKTDNSNLFRIEVLDPKYVKFKRKG